MKLIEAMKEIKRLNEKCADLRVKVARNAADLDFETPTYEDQRAQVGEWIQGHRDSVQRMALLRLAIQLTNLQTKVTIELGGNQVEKTLAEWIHWRRDLAKMNLELYAQLQDRNATGQPLRDGQMQNSGGTVTVVKIRRYYDPAQRDEMMALYRSQPSIIDATLEVVNATTDLVMP